VNRLQRITTVYRTLGLRAVATRAVNRIRQRIGLLSEHQIAWNAKKAAVDSAFDIDGIDTGGVQHLYELTINSTNARHGISHIACDPAEFAAAMRDVRQNLAESTFIDFGSGKGRVLLMAAEYPFQKIVGVEFARELYAIAGLNLLRRPDPRIDLIHGDVTHYDPPASPLVVFLFNPFGAPVVADAARALLDSWRSHRRPISVIYVNPMHANEWINAGWRETARGLAHAIFVPDEMI
jgi:hypothetical protein